MMKTNPVWSCIVALLLAVGSDACHAFPAASPSHYAVPPANAWLAEGENALPPIAFIRFCMTYPNECKQDDTAKIVALNAQLEAELHSVNALVNRRIAPNARSGGTVPWSLETSFGDCNDYAVQKRHELLQRGWPMSSLSLAVVLTQSGIGHLVLTVRTTNGDYVLDNLKAAIVSWNATGYRFLRRQAIEKPRRYNF